jgi:hypothetical protein
VREDITDYTEAPCLNVIGHDYAAVILALLLTINPRDAGID